MTNKPFAIYSQVLPPKMSTQIPIWKFAMLILTKLNAHSFIYGKPDLLPAGKGL